MCTLVIAIINDGVMVSVDYSVRYVTVPTDHSEFALRSEHV